MKFRLILSLVFTIATTFTALHEVAHIHGHDSATCQVCIVDDHSVSADVLCDLVDVVAHSLDEAQLQNQLCTPHAKKSTNHSNAPPLLS